MEIYPVRPMSANALKSKGGPQQQKPKEGTFLREVYDMFVDNPGKLIEVTPGKRGRVIETLRTHWGLDIRVIRQGSSRVNKKSLWALVAYWDGKEYVDCYTPKNPEFAIPRTRSRQLR